MERLNRRPNLGGRPSVLGVDMEDGQEAAPDRSLDFDDTFRRCFGTMVRSLAVAAGDREVAADCVQDAFMRAYVRWHRVSRLDDPVGWIRHVAVNRMRDHFRKTERGSRALVRLRAQQPLVAEAPREPTELAALLAQLPPQQRIAAALFYVEDLSVSEIADAMRLSEGAVKYHLHAARATLRGALEPQS
jgi:RNA polymerase sigma-70 factor (ECF subfamily)